MRNVSIKELFRSPDLLKRGVSLPDIAVSGISCNSKEVKYNYLFVAIKGNKTDGNEFIEEAIEKGARVIVTQHPAPNTQHLWKNTLFISSKDTRKALAKLAGEFYGHPSSKMKVTGVTGTNGKTTVTYLMEAILKEAKSPCAVLGTINYRLGGKTLASNNTTPGALDLQSILSEAHKQKIGYAIMEVSSHALDQDRTLGISYHCAIFTNLTQDHLDYHKTKENYFKSKARLFKGLPKDSFAVINNDDKYGRRLQKLCAAEVLTYGIDSKADVSARDISFDCRKTEFVALTRKEKIKIVSPLIGRHNVYNILAATAWAQKCGISSRIIKSAVRKFALVPGRLERIDSSKDFSVFVDYAHTEDALKNIISSLRSLTNHRVFVVFGCGGERDKTKRPKMGKVVSELADYSVITNDNPRSEDPERIISDILKGMSKINYCVIPERESAIKKCLSLARKGDIVLVAGKGHENHQIMRDKIIDFDDRKVIRKCLRSMKS
jgi:UDP-N-acetylmuramoyl-L-alanyl-D-glutamate--2,6-diaminopimelate ligase